MTYDMLIDVDKGLTRVALVDGCDLVELRIEQDEQRQLTGNIYKGKVQNTLPGMQAAFVDIGLPKNAFLYAGDVICEQKYADFGVADEQRPAPPIRSVAKIGQDMLVQVIREPGGTKGPRVSTHITLPGRYVVLMPLSTYIGVSRRIEDEGERARLRAEAEKVAPEGMGVIVRTAGEGYSAAEFAGDIAQLHKLWCEIEDNARRAHSPACVFHDIPLYIRILRDLLSEDMARVIINNRKAYERALDFVQAFSPALAGRIHHYSDELPIFTHFGIETKVDKFLARKVWLKSGGYLIFDHTEALTVIDVNSGKFVGSKDLQDTIYQLNLEAAREISRQVRLRNLGGIIIIDFVDMEDEDSNRDLVEELRETLKGDCARTNVVSVSALGLVEMTRKKSHKALLSVMKRPCPCCKGEGMVLKVEHVARNAIREAHRMRASGTSAPLLIYAQAEIAAALEGLCDLVGVAVKVDNALGLEEYRVEACVE